MVAALVVVAAAVCQIGTGTLRDYAGRGVMPAPPGIGLLDSVYWAASVGSIAFSFEGTPGDPEFAGGVVSSTQDPTACRLTGLSADVDGAIAVLPDLGCPTVRVTQRTFFFTVPDGGATLKFRFWTRNAAAGVTSVVVSTAVEDISQLAPVGAPISTPAAADATPRWVSQDVSIPLPAVPAAAGGVLYVEWAVAYSGSEADSVAIGAPYIAAPSCCVGCAPTVQASTAYLYLPISLTLSGGLPDTAAGAVTLWLATGADCSEPFPGVDSLGVEWPAAPAGGGPVTVAFGGAAAALGEATVCVRDDTGMLWPTFGVVSVAGGVGWVSDTPPVAGLPARITLTPPPGVALVGARLHALDTCDSPLPWAPAVTPAVPVAGGDVVMALAAPAAGVYVVCVSVTAGVWARAGADLRVEVAPSATVVRNGSDVSVRVLPALTSTVSFSAARLAASRACDAPAAGTPASIPLSPQNGGAFAGVVIGAPPGLRGGDYVVCVSTGGGAFAPARTKTPSPWLLPCGWGRRPGDTCWCSHADGAEPTAMLCRPYPWEPWLDGGALPRQTLRAITGLWTAGTFNNDAEFAPAGPVPCTPPAVVLADRVAVGVVDACSRVWPGDACSVAASCGPALSLACDGGGRWTMAAKTPC